MRARVDFAGRGGVGSRGSRRGAEFFKEESMPISWRNDFEATLKEAKAQRRPILLDFNATPT